MEKDLEKHVFATSSSHFLFDGNYCDKIEGVGVHLLALF